MARGTIQYFEYYYRAVGSMDGVRNHKDGFIIIAVLWITLLLSILALNISTGSRLSGIHAMNIQERVMDTHILYSGITLGYHEHLKYLANPDLFEQVEGMEISSDEDRLLLFPRFEPYLLNVGEKDILVQIRNIQGRIDINQAGAHLIQEIVLLCGADGLSAAASITDSILDWIDHDDLVRAGGAEKDYYLGLPRPYLPKNNQIEDIRELLMVKGVSTDMFYGTEYHPGMVHFFGALGSTEKMEINSAAPETFIILGDLDQEIIQDLISARALKPISSLAELGHIIHYGYYDQLEKYYKVSQASEIEIRAFKVLSDNRTGRWVSKIFKDSADD